MSGEAGAISGSLEVPLTPQLVSAALRPSEYTAALIQVLRARIAWVRGANRSWPIGAGCTG